MRTLALSAVLVLFSIISIISLGPSAFADHSEVTIETAMGSGAPGCEETEEGCYIPSTAIVDVGGKVIMSNTDTAAHTFTAGTPEDGPSGEFDTGLLMAGNSFEYSPDTVGEIDYFCMVHPWMQGLIVVQEVEAEEETMEEPKMMETMEEPKMMETMEEEPIHEIDIGNSALWVEISGDKVYATNPEDGTIVVIDATTNEIIDTITSVKGVTVVEVVEEKNKIYATALQKAPVYVYDLTTGEKLGEIDIGEPEITLFSKGDKPYGQREYTVFNSEAVGLAYDSTTELLYAVHSTVNHVNVIDTNTDKDLGDIAAGKRPLLIELDEQRGIGYVTNWESNNVSVLDLKTRTLIKSLNTGFVPDQMAVDHDNNRLYVTHHASPHVSVIDLRTQEIETNVEIGGITHAIAFDKKNGFMLVTYLPESGITGMGAIDKVEFIDTNSNKVIGAFNINTNPFTIAIDSENQKLFATRINDGVVVAVDLTIHPEYQEVISKIQAASAITEPSEGGGCLIATAAYGTELSPQIQFLREIRDNTVMSTSSGMAFMTGFNQLYYSFSPTIADMEREHPMFQEAVRAFITPMISTLSIMTLADNGSEVEVLGLGISVIALNLGMYIAAPAVVAWQIKKRF